MSTSAIFKINGQSVPGSSQYVAEGSLVTLTLADTSGVKNVTWSFHGHYPTDQAKPVITKSGTPFGSTATFTIPVIADGYGQAWGIKCVVNGGKDAAGATDTNLTYRSAVYVYNSQTRVPIFPGETLEADLVAGWGERLNDMLATVGSPTLATGPTNTVLWSNGTTNAWTVDPKVTSVAVGATTASAGAVRLAHAGVINARDNADANDRAVISYGSVATDTVAVGNTSTATRIVGSSLDAFVGATQVVKLGIATTDYLKLGDVVSTTGVIRVDDSFALIQRNGNPGTADRTLLSGSGEAWQLGDTSQTGAGTIRANGVTINGQGSVLADATTFFIRTAASGSGWEFYPGSGLMHVANSSLTPSITHATHATTPHTFTIQAQDVTTGTGSSLKLQSGTGSVANGQIQFFSGTTQLGTMSLVAGSYWGFSANASSGYAFYANSSGQGITFQAAAANGYARFDADTIGFGYNAATYAVTFRATGTAINITQAQRASDTPTATFTIQAQNAWGSATGTNRNGANLDLKAGTKATGGTDGQVRVFSGSGFQNAIFANGQCSFYGTTEIDFFMGGSFKTLIDGSAWRLKNGCQLRWDNENTAPEIAHSIHTTDTATGNLAIQAQSAYASATGTNRDGGNLLLKSGVSAVGGATSKIRMYGANTVGGTAVEHFNFSYVAATSMATLTSVSGHILIVPGSTSGLYLRGGSTSGGVYIDSMTTGDAINIRTGPSGDPVITAKNKNVALFDATGSFGSGVGVVYVKDRTTAPTTDPSGGGLLYSEGGELFWRSSSGVVTQLTP